MNEKRKTGIAKRTDERRPRYHGPVFGVALRPRSSALSPAPSSAYSSIAKILLHKRGRSA